MTKETKEGLLGLLLIGIMVGGGLYACSDKPENTKPKTEAVAVENTEPKETAQQEAEIKPTNTSSGIVYIDPNKETAYEKMEKSAFAGDYGAQRNLAYTLKTSLPYNPILGCAWRIVIIESGSEKVDQSDTGNKKFDCEDSLNPDELMAAQAQAKQLQAKIAAR